jgi:hypothetical protein
VRRYLAAGAAGREDSLGGGRRLSGLRLPTGYWLSLYLTHYRCPTLSQDEGYVYSRGDRKTSKLSYKYDLTLSGRWGGNCDGEETVYV